MNTLFIERFIECATEGAAPGSAEAWFSEVSALLRNTLVQQHVTRDRRPWMIMDALRQALTDWSNGYDPDWGACMPQAIALIEQIPDARSNTSGSERHGG